MGQIVPFIPGHAFVQIPMSVWLEFSPLTILTLNDLNGQVTAMIAFDRYGRTGLANSLTRRRTSALTQRFLWPVTSWPPMIAAFRSGLWASSSQLHEGANHMPALIFQLRFQIHHSESLSLQFPLRSTNFLLKHCFPIALSITWLGSQAGGLMF